MNEGEDELPTNNESKHSSKNVNIDENNTFSQLESEDDITWHDSLEQILSELADESSICSYLHNKAHLYYRQRNIRFVIPSIVISSICGSMNFISSSFPEYSEIIILSVGGLSIFTGIISTINQFLKSSELSESNRVCAQLWTKLHNNIKFQLRRKRAFRNQIKAFLSDILNEYQRLTEISPPIPEHISDIIKKRRKNLTHITLPSYIADFHHMLPYTNKEEVNEIIKTRPPQSVETVIDIPNTLVNELQNINEDDTITNINNSCNSSTMDKHTKCAKARKIKNNISESIY